MTTDNFEQLKKELDELREKVDRQEHALSEVTSEDDDEEISLQPSLVEILENPEITKAVNTAVSAWANTRPDEMKLRFRFLHLSLAFNIFVFAAIGSLGYLNVISKDVTGSLLGALIGYWYGKYQSNKSS
jgi:hypothetical protein